MTSAVPSDVPTRRESAWPLVHQEPGFVLGLHSRSRQSSPHSQADATPHDTFHPVMLLPIRSSSMSATCLPPTRRLLGSSGASDSESDLLRAHEEERNSDVVHTRHLADASDREKQSPSPGEEYDLNDLYDEYHDLTGGVDPYDSDAAAAAVEETSEADNLSPAATMADRLFGYASHKVHRVVEIMCSCLMSFAVIFSLFAEPIRLGYAPRIMDGAFLVCTIFVLALFLIEAVIYWFFVFFAPTQPMNLAATSTTPTHATGGGTTVAADVRSETPQSPTSLRGQIQKETEIASSPLSQLMSYPSLDHLLHLCSLVLHSDANPLLRVVSLLPTAWGLEVVLDYLAICSLVPDILDIAQIVSLTRTERDILLILKAGFLIRMIALIRCIPVDIFQLWIRVSDRAWWAGVAHTTSRQVIGGLQAVPSPIRRQMRQMGLAGEPESDASTATDGATRSDAVPIKTAPAVTVGSDAAFVSPQVSPPSLSSLSLQAPLTRLSATPPLSTSSSHATVTSTSSTTPPTHPVLRIVSESQSPKNMESTGQPESFYPRLPELLGSTSRPSSRSSSGFIAPFSPRVSICAVSHPPSHHRSPLLLHRQLPSAATTSTAPPAAVAASTAVPPSKLISLSSMSPMAHRRVLSSDIGASPSPRQADGRVGQLLTLPPHVARGLSLPNTVSPLAMQRRIDTGRPTTNRALSTTATDVGVAMAPVASPRYPVPGASRMINLSSMSPMVSGRALMARHAQPQAPSSHMRVSPALGTTSSSSSSDSSTPTSQSSGGGGGGGGGGAALAAQALLHPISQVSPLSRVRSLGQPSHSLQSSPVLSSRALSGMAALRELHLQQQRPFGSNLTPPTILAQPNSGSGSESAAQQDVSPQITISRSACTSPLLRHRRPTGGYQPDQEPASASSSYRGVSPNLLYHEVEAYHADQMEGEMAQQDESTTSPLPPSPPPPVPAQFSHASHIGQLLSDYTAHRVIIGLLLVVSLWNVTNPLHVDQRPRFGLERIEHHFVESTRSSALTMANGTVDTEPPLSPIVDRLLQQYQIKWSPHLLLLRVGSQVILNQSHLIDSLRAEEIMQLRAGECESWLDVRIYSQLNARFDLFAMVWLILMLPILLCVIYKDVHAVVTPIERMVSFVTNLARDPLNQIGQMQDAKSAANETQRIDTTAIIDVSHEMQSLAETDLDAMTPLTRARHLASSAAEQPTMASSFVEVTLQKLALLLQVGFGSAGGEIIAQNIIGDYLDPMIPGCKVFAVFGFCDIGEFNKCTETLEESIMMFVNQIASIVHESCHHFGGTVNKNIGPAFLLVWKFDTADMKALKAAMHHTHTTYKARQSVVATPIRQTATAKRLRGGDAPTPNLSRPSSLVMPPQSVSRLDMPLTSRERSASMRTAAQRGYERHQSLGGTSTNDDDINSTAPAGVTRRHAIGNGTGRLDLSPSPTSQLTHANLASHEQAEADANAPSDPPSRRSTSRSLISRRLSTRSGISVDTSTEASDTQNGEDEDFALLRPRLQRITSDVTRSYGQQQANEDGDGAQLRPHRMAKRQSVGEGELILKPSASQSEAEALLAVPHDPTSPRFSVASTESASSGSTSPRFLSADSSTRSSTTASTIPSPTQSSFAATPSQPKSYASTAMSRLLKLDSESQRLSSSRVDEDARKSIAAILQRAPIMHARRASQSFVPPTAIDENEQGPSPISPLPGLHQSLEQQERGTTVTVSVTTPTSTSSSSSSPPVINSARVKSTPISEGHPAPSSASALYRVAPKLLLERQQKRDEVTQRLKRSDSLSSLASSQSSSTASHSNTSRAVPTSPPVRTTVHRIAHQALSSFLSTIIQIATASSMERWKTDAHLQARMPTGYNGPTMGFGLHVGWAIEGAIGSSHKIDASYLSPNVNLAARLCSATRQYRIPFLFSGSFYKLLDTQIQSRCRHLDQVLLKGSSQPMDLYTFDICPGWKEKAVVQARRESDATDTDAPAPPAASASSVGGPSNVDLRAEWFRQVASINFRLPARKPSNAFTTQNETAAAAASAAAEAANAAAIAAAAGSADAATNSHSAKPTSSGAETGAAVSQANGSGAAHLSSASSSSSSDPPNGAKPASTSLPATDGASASTAALDSANAAIISQLNSLLAQLQCDLPEKYVSLFNRGIRWYLHGNWPAACGYLVRFQAMHREYVLAAARTNGVDANELNTVDGPSNLIMQYMGRQGFQAPKGWKGHRKLEKK